jgi:glycosyltransferase involved in cell wall biosynthesis
LKNISFITAHFHDFGWTEMLIRQIRATTPADCIREIIIIDQDRSLHSRARLSASDSLIRVVQYPKEKALFKLLGHDHPAVLNQAIKEAQGDWICLFDSDAHPIKSDWLSSCAEILKKHDAILAEDPLRPGMSHPCFMLLQRKHTSLSLRFDEGLLEMQSASGQVAERNDTGRMIRKQLVAAGEQVYLAEPDRAFDGSWGSFYLDCVYHHGSGSFKGGNELLKRHLTWENRFFENWVLNRRKYKLHGLPRRVYQFRAIAWDLRNKALTAVRLRHKCFLFLNKS